MIYFYNTFHNGDVHYSRTFVKDLMSKFGSQDYYYLHNNNPDILKDLPNLKHDNSFISFDNWNLISNYPITYFDRLIANNNNLYINTWVGQQNWITTNGINRNRDNRYCSLYSLYEMYQDTYKILNIPIENIDYYLPEIDFDGIQKENIDNFFQNINFDKKILICNNEPRTIRIELNIDEAVVNLSKKYPNILFLLTKKSSIIAHNVVYTSDIINLPCDLNELGYLTTFCDIIIGRPSGPYCFCMNKISFSDKNKTFITISHNVYDMFYFESNSNMILLTNHTSDGLINKIEEII